MNSIARPVLSEFFLCYRCSVGSKMDTACFPVDIPCPLLVPFLPLRPLSHPRTGLALLSQGEGVTPEPCLALSSTQLLIFIKSVEI